MNDCLAVCNLLKAAASCCERELNESLSALDVSHCQATIVLKLSEGPVSMSALSKEMCCHKSNITQIVSGLEKKGLIEREDSVTDKRVCHLKLTSKGKSSAGKLQQVLSGRACDCMGVFTKTEKKTFATLLQKYIDHHRE